MNLENFPVVLPCKVYNIRVMSLNKISKKKKKKSKFSIKKITYQAQKTPSRIQAMLLSKYHVFTKYFIDSITCISDNTFHKHHVSYLLLLTYRIICISVKTPNLISHNVSHPELYIKYFLSVLQTEYPFTNSSFYTPTKH